MRSFASTQSLSIFKSLVVILLALPLFAQASDNRLIEINDPVGTATIQVEEVGEPVYSPLLLTLKVKCKNGKVVAPIRESSVCDYREHSYDKKSKNLILNYSTINENNMSGPAECTEHWAHTFNLKVVCAQ